MYGIKIEKDRNFKKTEQLIQELEFRTTSFFRLYVAKLSEFYKKQIMGRYKKIKDEEAQIISDNLINALVDYKKVPRKEITKTRKETKTPEEHYSAVLVKSVKRSAREVNKDTHVIKVIPNKRGLKQVSGGVFVLQRYGPWHMDQLPYIPNNSEATILFVKTNTDSALAIKKKNKRQKSKVQKILKSIKVKYWTRKEIENNLDGYDDLAFWALRREFGIDGPKMRAWRPALDYIIKKGYLDILKKDMTLLKILFDANFKNYKNIDKKYKIVKEDDLQDLLKFQERVRG